ncbi:hypothetical protein D7X75_39445 [Corallococcus sp. CA031C]|nr:hypothetical protein D7X75_39445 [Corallococcus sp. CA031C]
MLKEETVLRGGQANAYASTSWTWPCIVRVLKEFERPAPASVHRLVPCFGHTRADTSRIIATELVLARFLVLPQR